jgi:putative endonuclease
VDVLADRRARLGRRGEDAALGVYARAGYRLIARNWRCPLGELDLVLARPGSVVVCEVKTRSGSAFGAGYDAVNGAKRRRLRRLARAFVRERGLETAAVRFDVASVFVLPGGTCDVELFQDAF